MKRVIAIVAAGTVLTVGCGTLDKLSRLTEKSTVEECVELTTAIVAKACRNAGNVKDKAQALVDNVNTAVDLAKQ